MNLPFFSHTAGIKTQAYKKCYNRQNSGETFQAGRVTGTTGILYMASSIRMISFIFEMMCIT